MFAFLCTMRVRLTLWNVFILALMLVVLGSILRAAVTHNLIASIDTELAHRALRHQEFWANVPDASHMPSAPHRDHPDDHPPHGDHGPGDHPDGPSLSAAPAFAVMGKASRWRAPVIERVFDLKGRQSFPPFEREAPWNPAAFAQAARGRENDTIVFEGGDRVRVRSAPLRRRSGELAGVVQVGASLADVDRSLRNLNTTLLTLTPVALLVAGLGGLLLTGRMLRPLRQVNHEIALIRAEDLSRRLAVSGQDEFADLATNVNAMLSRLDQSFEQQRRFTSDASHELRTPLTVIKAYSSRGICDPDISEKHRKAWAATDRAASLMNAIVQSLLLLARSDAGQLSLQLHATSLRESVEAAIDAVQEESGAPVTNDVPGDLMVNGDGILLTRVFTNLLSNARRHTPENGHITVSAEVRGKRIAVMVADTGTGIAPEHLPHVTERFYRVDEARSRARGGTGLGLAICQSIVSAHGGSLEIRSSPGAGTTVLFSLCRVDR